MNILILNGSPRANGNTVKMINAFTEGAQSSGHNVNVVNVCKKNIKGCMACECCHSKTPGVCCQKDDMNEVYELLKETHMLVLASPVYYFEISGQLKCAVDRLYACAFPAKPEKLTKFAMFLSSASPNVYDGAICSMKSSFVDYLGLENLGIYATTGYGGEETLNKLNELGKNLK